MPYVWISASPLCSWEFASKLNILALVHWAEVAVYRAFRQHWTIYVPKLNIFYFNVAIFDFNLTFIVVNFDFRHFIWIFLEKSELLLVDVAWDSN